MLKFVNIGLEKGIYKYLIIADKEGDFAKKKVVIKYKSRPHL